MSCLIGRMHVHKAIIREARGESPSDFLLFAETPRDEIKRRCVICNELKPARQFAVCSASCRKCR